LRDKVFHKRVKELTQAIKKYQASGLPAWYFYSDAKDVRIFLTASSVPNGKAW
jgi:hypothetical protein